MFGAPSERGRHGGRGVPHRPVVPEPLEGVQIEELLECGCCFESECLITDMSPCPEGHLFCKECIRRFAENEIGDAKTKFKCLDGECTEEFSFPVLQGLLSARLFKKLVQMKQMEEVLAAQIEGFETCPFCEFGSIPDPADKIFHCQNPDCMKNSCRQCREISHIPLRCDEVEKDKEMQARKNIEDRMTNVLVRECWQCKKKFVKLDGCNKMVCTCGAKMCYICRKSIDNYSHFTETNAPGKCPLWSNNDELHVNAVVEEGERALRDLKTEDPTLNLKHDPTKVLPVPEQPAHQGQQGRVFHGNQGGWLNVFINGQQVVINNQQDQHFNQHMDEFARGMHQFGERMRAQFEPMQAHAEAVRQQVEAHAEAVRQQAEVQGQMAAEQGRRAAEQGRRAAEQGRRAEARQARQHAHQARLQAAQERVQAQNLQHQVHGRWQGQHQAQMQEHNDRLRALFEVHQFEQQAHLQALRDQQAHLAQMQAHQAFQGNQGYYNN